LYLHIISLPFARNLAIFQRCATACTETRYTSIRRATITADVGLRCLSEPPSWDLVKDSHDESGSYMNKIEHDTAYSDTISMRETIGIIDLSTVNHHTVAAAKVANVDAIETV
jgi:hypothetical protein